jgi:hypothetical protein
MNGVQAISSQGWQEWAALAVVFAAAFLLLEAPFRGIVLKRLSEMFLRKGRVKWAMRLRGWSDPRWAAATSGKKGRGSRCE